MADPPETLREAGDRDGIHGADISPDDPFATPLEDRRLDRRFRGRLVAPVTVWTAGSGQRRAGLTVSSLLVAEGDPAEVLGLLDPLSDLFALVAERRTFVVHVLEAGEQRLGGVFAGALPVDPFDEVEVVNDEFGPLIRGPHHSLRCRLRGSQEIGFQMLVQGVVETFDIVADSGQPLVRYRGRYRKLSPET